MSASLNYYWRLAATGGCFATFGIGGLVLSALVFPILLLLPGEVRSRHARWLIHQSCALFMRLMETVGIMHLEVIGAQRLRSSGNTLVLANHPTLIDAVALISLMPHASCVVKRALWKNPFLGGVVRSAGYISNAEPETLIDDCVADLVSGNPLLVFPEGTRSEPGKPLHFLRGAAYIALQSGLPIVPVLIDCSPSTLTKREKWYHIPPRPFHLRIEVLAPISASRWVEADEVETIAARKLTRALEAYFTQQLERNRQDGRS